MCLASPLAEPGHPARREQKLAGEVDPPHPRLGRPGEDQQRLVGVDAQAVVGAQLGAQLARDRRLRAHEAHERVDRGVGPGSCCWSGHSLRTQVYSAEAPATTRSRCRPALRRGTASANPSAAVSAITHIRNESVKPVAVGMSRAPRLSARSVAASCPPKAPPRVRVTAFIPVATPVCSWLTFWTIRFAMAEKERPMPMPSSPA